MGFLNSKTKRTRVSNIICVNHAGATLISQEQYSQGGPKASRMGTPCQPATNAQTQSSG